MSETELLDEVMQLRRALCDIEEYEINWAVGTGDNMAKVQLMAVTALNRPIPVAAPSPGIGVPVSTEPGTVSYGPPMASFPLAPPPTVTGGDFVAGVNGGPPTATPMTPAAEPGKPAHDWTSAPGIGWACEHCRSFRRVQGATELSRGFEYRLQNKRKWGPDEPPCAGERYAKGKR